MLYGYLPKSSFTKSEHDSSEITATGHEGDTGGGDAETQIAGGAKTLEFIAFPIPEPFQL